LNKVLSSYQVKRVFIFQRITPVNFALNLLDLADGGPEKILHSFSVLTRLRLLVCGGDGTVSWIISALDKMNLERWPPIAILPLGTGNDLARVHGWGGGYANESLLVVLNQVQESYVSLLDRWEMSIVDKSVDKVRQVKAFTNYMSIGSDALSALQLHNLRENSPDLFFSRAINKVWYALFGAEDAIKASCAGLPQQVKLIADGVEIPIPEDSQGIIFLNIDSYLGGVALWSRGVRGNERRSKRRLRERRYSDGDLASDGSITSGKKRKARSSFDYSDSITGDDNECDDGMSLEDKFLKVTSCDRPSSCQDGKLDVISYRGNFHLGQIRVGLANAQLLCQCSEATITLKKTTAVQIDGEPHRRIDAAVNVILGLDQPLFD